MVGETAVAVIVVVTIYVVFMAALSFLGRPYREEDEDEKDQW